MPGVNGLLHVSERANYRVANVRDELKEGEGTSPKYPGAGEAHAASGGGGDDRGGRGGDRNRGPRRDRDRAASL
jgi:hypothetical protein